VNTRNFSVMQGVHAADATSLLTLSSTSNAAASPLMVRKTSERWSLYPTLVASGITSS
jgi:hypothetical protein